MFKSPPKTLKNQNVPSRSESDLHKMPSEEPTLSVTNVTQRAKRRCPSNEGASELSAALASMKTEIINDIKAFINELVSAQNSRLDKLENHFKEIKGQYIKIEDTSLEIEKSMTYMSDQLTALESKILNLEKERASTTTKLSMLDEKLESLERSYVKTCVEIRNVPKRPQETKKDLYCFIKQLSQILQLELQERDIRDVARQPSKRDSRVSNITIEFSNTLTKYDLLASAKNFNKRNPDHKLNSSHLGFEGAVSPVYIAEQLTSQAKKLFYVTRNFAKANQYTHCWTSNGRVLLRKGKDTPHILVKNDQQLHQLAMPTIT